MGNSFRRQPFATTYEPLRTPVGEDDVQVGLLVAFGMIAFSFLLVIPGIRGLERLWATIRVFVALWIGAVILVCNYGSWYSDSICTRTQYMAHTGVNSPQLIEARVGLSIGLRSINITLLETECTGLNNESYARPFPDEIINYEEQFSWADPWGQGRLDFGLYGGRFNREFRAAKFRGMPYPILWIAEHFTLDGEQIIWYRKFRVAGWLTQYLLWVAFATYLLSIACFVLNIRWGAIYMLITGLLLLLSCLTYGVTIINDPPLTIRFSDGTLSPQFNWAFWLVLWTGFLSTIAALVILFIDLNWPRKTAEFFHHSIIVDDTMFEGGEEDEDENGLDQFGLVSQNSKVSLGTTAGGETSESEVPRRYRGRGRGTRSHIRDSVRSTRSDVLSRDGSTRSGPRQTSQHYHRQQSQQQEIQLEEITVHNS